VTRMIEYTKDNECKFGESGVGDANEIKLKFSEFDAFFRK